MNGRSQRRREESHRQRAANRPNGWCPGNRSGNMVLATTQKTYQRYLALARAAGLAGDMIGMENYYQHAEHYFRVMRAMRETSD
jgi:Domain of unknown function (DUF4167)